MQSLKGNGLWGREWCVCVCERERERERGEMGEKVREYLVLHRWLSFLVQSIFHLTRALPVSKPLRVWDTQVYVVLASDIL